MDEELKELLIEKIEKFLQAEGGCSVSGQIILNEIYDLLERPDLKDV